MLVNLYIYLFALLYRHFESDNLPFVSTFDYTMPTGSSPTVYVPIVKPLGDCNC